MEPYVNLPEKTQLQMAAIRTLFRDPSISRDKIISLSYTDSEVAYPEKILNLKWGLCGDWKIFNAFAYFGEEKGFDKFCAFLLSRRGTFGKYQDYLSEFFYLGELVEVRGQDFETGIDNLFKLLTVEVSIFDGDMSVRPILIRMLGRSAYEGFCFHSEKCGFANLINPGNVPDYAKKFFDSMPKRIET